MGKHSLSASLLRANCVQCFQRELGVSRENISKRFWWTGWGIGKRALGGERALIEEIFHREVFPGRRKFIWSRGSVWCGALDSTQHLRTGFPNQKHLPWLCYLLPVTWLVVCSLNNQNSCYSKLYCPLGPKKICQCSCKRSSHRGRNLSPFPLHQGIWVTVVGQMMER